MHDLFWAFVYVRHSLVLWMPGSTWMIPNIMIIPTEEILIFLIVSLVFKTWAISPAPEEILLALNKCFTNTSVIDYKGIFIRFTNNILRNSRTAIELYILTEKVVFFLTVSGVTGKTFWDFKLLFLCINILPECMFVCHVSTVPMKVRKECVVPWGWS